MKRILKKVLIIGVTFLALSGAGVAQRLEKVGQCKTGNGICQAVFLRGDFAYVCEQASLLALVNVSNPASPWVEGSIGRPLVSPLSSYVKDTVAYLSIAGLYFSAISVATPSSPYELGWCQIPHGVTYEQDGIYVKDSIAYVCRDRNGLILINVANPRAPALFDSVQTHGWAYDLDFKDTLAYVTGYNPNAFYDSLLILNTANPRLIQEIGSCSVFPWIMDVVVSGNYAYTANWTLGGSSGANMGVMNIVDVSDPQNPTVVARIDSLVGAANAVYWDSNYVYVATRNYRAVDSTDVPGGVRVVDVHDPTRPKVVAGYDLLWPHDGFDVKAKFPYVYVAGRDSFFVLRFTPSGVEGQKGTLARILPEVELLQNAPNPVRERTEIEYHLGAPGKVQMTLYDVSGRWVRDLMQGVMSPGEYRVSWDRRDGSGRRVSSGIYLCQLVANEQSAVKKIIVID